MSGTGFANAIREGKIPSLIKKCAKAKSAFTAADGVSYNGCLYICH
jgi:hypothetical protein